MLLQGSLKASQPDTLPPTKGTPVIDKIVSVFVMALVITGLGIALRPGSQAPALAREILTGFAGIQRAAAA